MCIYFCYFCLFGVLHWAVLLLVLLLVTSLTTSYALRDHSWEVWRIIWDSRDWICIGHMQGKHPTHCSIALTLNISILAFLEHTNQWWFYFKFIESMYILFYRGWSRWQQWMRDSFHIDSQLFPAFLVNACSVNIISM